MLVSSVLFVYRMTRFPGMMQTVPRATWTAALAAALLLAVAWAAWPAEAQAQYFAFGKNKVQYEAHDWRHLQTPHFDVYYYEGGRALAQYTARAAEAGLAEVEALVQYDLAGRVPVLVYQGRSDFAVTNAVNLPVYATGIAGVTERFKNRIAVPFAGDYGAFRRVLHHEIVHAVLNDMLYDGAVQSIVRTGLQERLPLWFSEGLAEYAAQGWGTRPDRYLRAAVLRGELPPIDRLYGYLAYPAGQSVWDYLATQYGRRKIGEILNRLRLADSVEESIRQATGLSLEALSERWTDALREIYFPEVTARQRLEELARPLTGGAEHAVQLSPALDPQGDRVAYVQATGALFDVYLASVDGDRPPTKLIDGQQSTAFESLRLTEPGLTWSPDGQKVAVAVKSGASEAIAVVNVVMGGTEHYRLPALDQIGAIAWSPDGERMAFSGAEGGQSDLYVLDLDTRITVNYTDDVFSDHAPAWHPSGRALVFHSDRGPHVQVRRHAPGKAPMHEPAHRGSDLYLLPLGSATARRLTATPQWDDRSPRFGDDAGRLLFISDRNGIPNLYALDLTTGATRPVTDLALGVTQFSLSADGKRAAVVGLSEGRPAIYLITAPFSRRLGPEPPAPSVWAQRAHPDPAQVSPALAVAATGRRLRNPFLRDAADGVAYADAFGRPASLMAARTPSAVGPDTAAEAAASIDTTDERATDERATDERAIDERAAYGPVRITFGERSSGETHSGGTPSGEAPRAVSADSLPGSAPVASRVPERTAWADTLRYESEPYKLLFSPDVIYGAAGYDALYGVQGVAQVMFSDMMGNHRIIVSTNLLLDLRNADYAVSYSYLPRRTDWSVSVYHTARLLPSYEEGTYYRYRRYGLSVRASYPLDKFRRIDVDAGVMGLGRADIGSPRRPADTRALFSPALTFTEDVTAPGLLGPRSGHRLALRLSGGIGPVRFATLLGDARTYASFGEAPYTLAVRGAAGISVGPAPQLFFTAGVKNWLNRRFDPSDGFPVDDVTDFAFATPVMPLRGYGFNAQNGTGFGLVNVALRFPMRTLLSPRLVQWLPVYALQGALFADIGTLQGGPGADDRFRLVSRNEAGERVLDDLLVAVGGGLRTFVLGYPVRLDLAWPFDGQRFGDSRLYLSVGFDF